MRHETSVEIPSYARKEMAKTAAESLIEDYSTPAIPVIEIAESNGVKVDFVDFGDEYNDKVAGICEFKEARILVNAFDGVGRQRFTIAHELGHWILHRDIFLSNPERYPVLMRFQKPSEADPLEQEANYFAANLLVPEKHLKSVINAPISVLASVFHVSNAMMEIRVKDVKRK